MPTKQVKITLQASPDAGQDVNLVVAVDGTTKINQAVPAVGPAEQGITDPSETVQFDLDVANATANVANTVCAFSITATNGRAKIETIATNFTVQGNAVPGNATVFLTSNIVSQPLWNGQALLDRYDIAYNNGPIQITGPGEVLIESGETVTFDVAVQNFNDSLPS